MLKFDKKLTLFLTSFNRENLCIRFINKKNDILSLLVLNIMLQIMQV